MYQQTGLHAAIDVGTSTFGADLVTIAGARAATAHKPFSALRTRSPPRYGTVVFAGVSA